MILDYIYSRERKQMSISYIKPDGNKEIIHFDNINKFKTYYYDQNGPYDTWDECRCSTKYTTRPSKFDIKEFINSLSGDIQGKLNGKTFPNLYSCDIETRIKNKYEFTDPCVADQPVLTISVVSPNLNAMVLGVGELGEEKLHWVEDQFHKYLEAIPFYKTLNIKEPHFKYLKFDNEEMMLRWFFEHVVAKVPVLAGWNFIGYDWCYLTNRVKNFYPNLSIKISSLIGMVKNKRYINKKEEKIDLPHPVHTLVMDMMDVIDKEDKVVLPIKESLNLDYIANESLGANKITYSGSLQTLYEDDFPKYVFYNLIDSILVQLIDKRFRTMNHIYLYSLLAREKIGSCFSKISLTEALIVKHYWDHNIKIVYEEPEETKRDKLVGAYVREPSPGKWEYVVCNDFASLYPSSIRTCNLSFDNYLGPKVQFTDEELEAYRKDPNYFVSINGNVYKNDKDYTLKAIMSKLYDDRNHSKYLSKDLDAMVISDIDHILNKRDVKLHTYKPDMVSTMKAMGYDLTCGEDLRKMDKETLKIFEGELKSEITYLSDTEQAIKLMMNSIYGGTSNVNFYWFNIFLANDITGESRHLIHMMEDHLNSFWKTAWQTNPAMKTLQQENHITLKDDVTIKKILDESPQKSLATLVYGDTDSLYTSYSSLLDTIEGVEKMTPSQKLDIVLKINLGFMDDYNCKIIKEYYDTRYGHSVHKFELETVAKAGLWLEKKKKYGQILMYKDGKYFDPDDLKMKVKGLEVIKSSYPTISRKQLKQLLRFLLEYDGKYLTQELNLQNMKFKQDFISADIDDICGNIGSHNYYKYIESDSDPSGLKVRPKTPFHVRALGYYNWLNNTKKLGSEPIYGGKIKYYCCKGSSDKAGDIFFAYESTKYPEWANQYAPVDKARMYQKFVLDPFNRILRTIHMPILCVDGTIQMSLFG